MANNPIKTLADLEAYFKAGGTVTLDGSFLPPGATTLISTALLRSEQNIILSATGADVSLSTGGSTLTVTGTTLPAAAADSFLNLTSMTVDLMFQQPIVGNQPQFTFILRVTMGSGWTLGESFPVIAGMDTDSLPVVNSPYYYFSTFSAPQPAPPFDSSPLASGNIIRTGLNYCANIGYTGLFSLVNQILTAQLPTSIAIYGLITQTPSGPVFDLHAPFLDYTAPIKFGFIGVTTPWLGASVSYVALSDDNVVTPCAANAADCIPQLMLYIGAQIQLGAAPPLDIKAGMVGVDNGSGSVAPSETFTLSITPATPQGFGLGDIVSLTQLPVPSQALQYLNTVQLNAFNAGFSLNSSPALQYVQVLVGTDPYSFGPHLMAQFTLNWTQQFFSSSNSTSLVTFTAIFTLPEYPGMQFDIIVNLSPTVTITGVQSGPPVQLSLATMFPGVPNPGGLLEVEFSDFTISINPSQNQYSVGAVIGADFRLFGTDLLRLKDMAIQLELDKSSGNTQYTATFDGIVGLGPIDFAVNATFSNTTDCVLQLHLVNETLGTMINHLVHLVLPDYDVTFPAPWNKLADISLDALMLEVNITKGSVTLTYPTSINLGFLDITGITLTYQKQQTQSSSVLINIDGTFLGQSISENNPVGWDVINGQPPSAPGGGSSTFDLEYLGLGQHITFTDLDKLTTVELVMAALRNSVYPIGGGTQPTWGVNGLAFSSAGNWLIGAQFSLLQTVSLSVIFNDPNLYGLLIQLSGAKAKIFAGLSFEILYRKVSDTIGVYHIELKLPDAIRNLQFGEVSITLPVVILDIYTNGNFRIDMGFPKGLDFSQSFSLQIFPFVGYGGFYFALLNGQTSSRVPQITNGGFNPVIEFGIALSVGVGKTINEGVLSGGITVTVIGVLQGVVAWFHPSSSNVPEDQYYWVQGSISIVGKLYATIDFAVIKATLSVTAYATATLTVQAYAPIYISISAGVSVEVSVKIVFFTIHLKFSATVSASFTIGHASPTPWIVASGGGSNRILAAAGAPAMLRSHTPQIAGLAMVLRAQRASTRLLTGSPLNWNPVAVFSSPQPASANVFLSYTKSETTPGGVNAIFLQTISNSVNPNAQTAEQARIPFGPNPAAAGFNVLSEAMLRWAIAAVDGPNAATVTSDNLAYLKAALNQDGALASIMDYNSQLSPFLKLNVTMNVTAAQSTGSVVSGTILSVSPSLSVNGNSFLQPAIIDPPTQAKIDAYFELLQAQFEANQQQSTGALAAAPMKSAAQIMFEQYCGMVMKSAVQSAVRILAEYPYSAQAPFSINALQTALGDTSITASQLVNPNQKTAGILNPGATLQLSAILYPAKQGDSFNSVATAFNNSGVTNSQGQPLTFTDLTQQNLTTPALFSSGNSVTFTGISYTTQTGDSLNLIAARQLLRAAPVSVLQQINGLLPAETAIQAANTGVSQPIPAGTTVRIPASIGSLPAYVTVAGDTWPLIAAYALSLQSQVVAYSTYAAATLALNPNLPVKDPTQPQPAGTPVALAPIPRILQPGDTIQTLAQTLVSASTSPIESSLAAAPVLSPHAQIFMPPLLYKLSSADSFQAIAQKFNTTLDQIAAEIDPSADLFSGAALTVADLSQVTISTLVSTLLNAGEWNMNAGMVSRFLMAGLRLPNPLDPYFQSLTVEQLLDPVNLAKVVTVPMYALTGQQFPIASPPPAGYQVTVTNPDTTAPWLTIGTTGTLQFSPTQDEITFIAQLAQPMPDLELLNLTRLALYNLSPPRFSLQQHLTWQPAVPPSSIACMSTAQAAGSPSVWMFPDPMIQALDALPPSLPYELVAGAQESATGPMTISDVNCYGWGTLLNLQIQLPPPDQTANPNTFVIAGSDATGQDLLQAVYQHLTTTKDKAIIYILYPPNPVATFPSGLLSDQLDPDLSFVLKTNLSTLTQAPVGMMAKLYATPPPQTPYSAALGDAANFLNLTWEAGAVGGGGFYLSYVNANGGGSLPGHLFAGGPANIYLLIVVTNSTGGSQPLYSFNNCAIVGDNLDPGSVNLFAQPVVAVAQTTDTLDTIADAHNTAWGTTLQASDLGVLNQDNALMLQVGAQLSVNGAPYTIAYGDTLSIIAAANSTNVAALVNMTNGGGTNGTAPILAAGALLQFTTGVLLPVANVPPGITGFELTRANPDPRNLPFSQLSADDRIRLLYQMMGFSIAASSGYVASGAGLPAGPTVSNQDGGDGLTANSAASVPEEWNYQHTLSAAPFAVTANGSLSPALPPAADNPYNGVGQGEVTLNFALSDVYGNTQPLPSGYQSLGIPVGYTGQLTGIGQWPSSAAGYQVTGSPGSPSLEIDTSMQLDRYIPTASNSLASAQQAAKGDAAAYQTIYYQITQSDVSFYLQTSLDANSLTSAAPIYSIDRNAMLGFAESAWLYLTAVQSLQQQVYSTGASDTLASVTGTFGVSGQALLEANSALAYASVFGAAPLQVPAIHFTTTSDSLSSIGAPVQLTPSQIAERNTSAPLAAGLDLSIPTWTYNVPANLSLLQAALNARCTADGIANANHGIPNLLYTGFVMTVGGVSIPVAGGDSFDGMVTRFQNAGVNVTLTELAEAVQAQPGIFVPNAPLTIADVLTRQGDTLAAIAQANSITVDQIAASNAQLAGLFPPGTPIVTTVSPVTPESGATLDSYASSSGVTLAELAAQNEPTAFAQGAPLAIPGLASWPTPTSYSTYLATGSETLGGIASKFNQTAATIAALNPDRGGLFTPNQSITYGGKSASTAAASTFNSLVNALEAQGVTVTVAELASSLAAQAGLIAKSGIWITTLMNSGDGASNTLSGLCSKYNLDFSLLALANSCLQGFLASGVPVPFAGQTVTTQSGDTLQSLVYRFSLLGIQADVNSLAAAAATVPALLNPASPVIPPPQIISTSVSITPKLTAAVTPLTVEIVETRNPQWVDPDFTSSPSVATSVTSLSPSAENAAGEPLSLQTFAANLETALPGLHAATGSALSESDPDTSRRVWVVNFGNSAGPAVTYAFDWSSTRSFAVPPLSTSLMSGTVDLATYTSGQGLSSQTQPKTLQSVDLDVWAGQFLTAVDEFLYPGSAAGAFNLSPLTLSNIIAQKESLAETISNSLIPILANQTQDGLPDAQTALKQALRTRLSSAYTVSSLVQTPVTVTGPQSSLLLSGKPTIQAVTGAAVNDLTLTTAKVDLSQSTSDATFLLTVKSPASTRNLTLTLDYAANQLEMVQGQSGDYPVSDWLAFVNPLGTANSSNTGFNVPLPLRAYPSPISLVAQSSAAAGNPPPPPANLVAWDYTFTYEHLYAAQDTTTLQIVFNSISGQPPKLPTAGVNLASLFQALAQFISVYPALKNDLVTLPQLNPGEANQTAQVAAATFNTLVQAIAQAWAAPPPRVERLGLTAPGLPPIIYNYQMELTENNNGALNQLVLTSSAANPVWPSISVNVNGTMQPLTPNTPTPGQATYNYPSGIPVASSLQQQFTFPGQSMVTAQDGWAGAAITRNGNLLNDPPQPPDAAPAFIYQTPMVGFPTKSIPLIVNTNAIDIRNSGDLAKDLGAFFTALLGAASGVSYPIRAACSYGYQLAGQPQGPGLNSLLPVVLVPQYSFDPATDSDSTNPNSFVSKLQSYLTNWQNDNQPSTTNGAFYFDISLYSIADPQNLVPLTEAASVQFPLS